jgi:hypothetical protein
MEHKQLNFLINNGYYISPKMVHIGFRTEKRHCSSLGKGEMKNVVDTFQYVPLEQLLARIIIEC